MQHELLIGYNDRHTFLNRLSGSTKLLCFVGLSVIGMMTYDTRYLIGVMLFFTDSVPLLKNSLSRHCVRA